MKYIINGNNFNNYSEAYLEIKKIFTKGALNESITLKEMMEQFLVPNKETVEVIWLNSSKSRVDLGCSETTRYLKYSLSTVPISKTIKVIHDIKEMEKGNGPTLFDQVIESFDECNIKYTLK